MRREIKSVLNSESLDWPNCLHRDACASEAKLSRPYVSLRGQDIAASVVSLHLGDHKLLHAASREVTSALLRIKESHSSCWSPRRSDNADSLDEGSTCKSTRARAAICTAKRYDRLRIRVTPGQSCLVHLSAGNVTKPCQDATNTSFRQRTSILTGGARAGSASTYREAKVPCSSDHGVKEAPAIYEVGTRARAQQNLCRCDRKSPEDQRMQFRTILARSRFNVRTFASRMTRVSARHPCRPKLCDRFTEKVESTVGKLERNCVLSKDNRLMSHRCLPSIDITATAFSEIEGKSRVVQNRNDFVLAEQSWVRENTDLYDLFTSLRETAFDDREGIRNFNGRFATGWVVRAHRCTATDNLDGRQIRPDGVDKPDFTLAIACVVRSARYIRRSSGTRSAYQI
nr:hypothetical protein CFP56_11144 [Quercus suber]